MFDNIHYNAVLEKKDASYDLLNDGSDNFNGCTLDFRCMCEVDTLKRVVFRDVFVCDGAKLLLADERYEFDIRN